MILGQALETLGQWRPGRQPRSRPAWRMAPPSRLRSITAAAISSAGPGQHRPDRCAQALRQATGDGGGGRGPFSQRLPAGDGGMPQAGSVQVQRQAVAACYLARRRPGGPRSHTVPPAAMWVSSTVMAADLRLVVGGRRDQPRPPRPASKLPSSSGTVSQVTPALAGPAPAS